MNNLLVTYDLSQPGQNYERLLQLIKGYGDWARLGYSAYIIRTTDTPVAVRDRLRAVLDTNDKLYVGRVGAPAAWFGLQDEVSNWLQQKLQ